MPFYYLGAPCDLPSTLTQAFLSSLTQPTATLLASCGSLSHRKHVLAWGLTLTDPVAPGHFALPPTYPESLLHCHFLRKEGLHTLPVYYSFPPFCSPSLSFFVLEIKPRALHGPGKHCNTEPHPLTPRSDVPEVLTLPCIFMTVALAALSRLCFSFLMLYPSGLYLLKCKLHRPSNLCSLMCPMGQEQYLSQWHTD